MKLLNTSIGMAFLAIITTLTTACSNVGGTRISNNTTPAVQGGYTAQTTYTTVQKTVPPAAKVGLEIYGNQPSEPTAAAISNQTTWGQTFGGAMAYNEMRPKNWARLETPAADTLILLDTSTGYIWKVGCRNRLVVAQSRTIDDFEENTVLVPARQPQVASAGNNNIVDNSVHVDLKGAIGAVMKPVAAAVGVAGQALLQAQRQSGGCHQPHYRKPVVAPCPPPQRAGRPPQMHQPPPLPCPPKKQGKVQVRVNNVNVNGNTNGVIPVGGSSHGSRGTFSSSSRRPNGFAVDPRLVGYKKAPGLSVFPKKTARR